MSLPPLQFSKKYWKTAKKNKNLASKTLKMLFLRFQSRKILEKGGKCLPIPRLPVPLPLGSYDTDNLYANTYQKQSSFFREFYKGGGGLTCLLLKVKEKCSGFRRNTLNVSIYGLNVSFEEQF